MKSKERITRKSVRFKEERWVIPQGAYLAATKRLAEYENTGLSQEEVMKLKKICKNILKNKKAKEELQND